MFVSKARRITLTIRGSSQRYQSFSFTSINSFRLCKQASQTLAEAVLGGGRVVRNLMDLILLGGRRVHTWLVKSKYHRGNSYCCSFASPLVHLTQSHSKTHKMTTNHELELQYFRDTLESFDGYAQYHASSALSWLVALLSAILSLPCAL